MFRVNALHLRHRIRCFSSSREARIKNLSDILNLPTSEKPLLKFTNLVHKFNAANDYEMIWHALNLLMDRKIVPNHGMLNDSILKFVQDYENGGTRVTELFKVMLNSGYRPSRRTVSNILSVINRTKYSDLEKVMEIIKYIEDENNGIEMNETLAFRILDFFIVNGFQNLFDQYFMIFKDKGIIFEEKANLLLMKQLTTAGDIQAAIDLYKKMQKSGYASQSTAIDYLISALQKENRLNDVMNLYKSALSYSFCTVATLTSVISAIASAPDGKLDDIWNVYEDLKKFRIEPDLIFFCAVLEACAKKGSALDTSKVMNDMLEFEIQMDIRAFNNLLTIFIQTGDISSSWKTLEYMSELGILPNAITFTRLIFVLAKCREPSADKALEIFQQMLNSNIQPIEQTYIALFSVYANCSNPDPAYLTRIFQHMEQRQANLSTDSVNALIGIFTKQGTFKDLGAVSELFEKMGLKANLVSFNNYLRVLADKGEIDQVFEVLDFMKKCQVEPDDLTYNHLIRGLSNSGASLSLIFSYIDEFKKSGFVPKASTLNIIVNRFSATDELNRKAYMDALLDYLKSNSNLLDEKLGVEFASMCMNMGNEEGLMYLFGQMDKLNLISAYSIRMIRKFFKEFRASNPGISLLESFRFFNQLPSVNKFYEGLRKKDEKAKR